MVVKVVKCQMCGNRFEAECLDRDDPNERHRYGDAVTCPKCGSPRLEIVQVLRRVRSAG
jgi:DNA-directed RNA polymerase subunit RPC12/RpoP